MDSKFIEIDSHEKLDELFEKSNEVPVILFKHSNACPISFGVYDEVSNADAKINIVVVQKNRDISNLIAEKTGIRHQSPQAIVIKNGRPIYSASHYDITAADLETALKQ